MPGMGNHKGCPYDGFGWDTFPRHVYFEWILQTLEEIGFGVPYPFSNSSRREKRSGSSTVAMR